MHTLAVSVAYGLFWLVTIGAIVLAIVSVFWLPDHVLSFKRPEAMFIVPAATITVWLALSHFAVRIPGILVISPHKTLAALALICGLLWCYVEDNWL